EQFPEIVVSGAAFVSAGSRLFAVVQLDDASGRFTPGDAAFERTTPRGISGYIAGFIAQLIFSPFGVVAGFAIDVANRRHLNVRLLEKFEHDAGALSAHADAGQIQFVAWRRTGSAAQDAPRNDQKRRRGGAREQRAAGNSVLHRY